MAKKQSDYSADIATARRWVDEMRERAALDARDAELVNKLAVDILSRWRARAEATKKPVAEFNRLKRERSQAAVGAIVAIVELVRAIGQGADIPREWVELMQ